MPASGDTISVIIPLYNRREEIGRAIASALRQSHAPHEIVVVDDSSRDNSASAVAALGDQRIRLLRHERNRGAAAARNTGIAAAEGEWIALLDSDDEWEPEKLARQLAALQAAPAHRRRASPAMSSATIAPVRSGPFAAARGCDARCARLGLSARRRLDPAGAACGLCRDRRVRSGFAAARGLGMAVALSAGASAGRGAGPADHRA